MLIGTQYEQLVYTLPARYPFITPQHACLGTSRLGHCSINGIDRIW